MLNAKLSFCHCEPPSGGAAIQSPNPSQRLWFVLRDWIATALKALAMTMESRVFHTEKKTYGMPAFAGMTKSSNFLLSV